MNFHLNTTAMVDIDVNVEQKKRRACAFLLRMPINSIVDDLNTDIFCLPAIHCTS